MRACIVGDRNKTRYNDIKNKETKNQVGNAAETNAMIMYSTYVILCASTLGFFLILKLFG